MKSVKESLINVKTKLMLIWCFQGNEKKVYEFVVRHFLACVSQDAQGFETTVEIDIANEKVSLILYIYT